jgi:serine/threonine protein phosphatase PrpC
MSTIMLCPRCGTGAPADDHFCETCGLRLVAQASQIQGPAELGPDIAIVTDIGKRHARNEDAGAIVGGIVDGQPAYGLVVCDGVSSASSSNRLAAGAAASARSALIDLLQSDGGLDPRTGIADVVRIAHRAACALDLESEPGKDPPGATMVTAVAWPGRISVGWLGDSRAYWVTGSGAVALTHDDSVTPASHAITHCIGPLEDDDGPLEPHAVTTDVSSAGLLVLCSDGFWNYTADEDAVAAVVRSGPTGADAQTIARTLVQFALDAGGIDNVTVAVARVASNSNGAG